MNIKRLIFALVLSALAVAALPKEGRCEQGRPILSTYGDREIGDGGESWDAVQDGDGMLYVGTDGVLSFDGTKWRHYPVPGTYAVLGMALGEKGRLWISAINEIGYFNKSEKGLSEYHSLVGFLPKDERDLGEVWQVLTRGKDVVFVAQEKVLVWDGARFDIHRLPGTRRIVASIDGNQIFFSHGPTGTWLLDDDGFRIFIPAETIGNRASFLTEKTPKGWTLVTTEGVFHLESGILTQAGTPEISDLIRKSILVAAKRAPGGDLYLGTFLGGLIVLNPTGTAIKRIMGPEEGLPSRSVYSLLFASDHSLWTTSPVGIAHIAVDSGVTLFNASDGLAGKNIQGLVATQSRLLVATDGGVFGLDLAGGSPSHFDPVRALSKKIMFLEKGLEGTVYAAGYKRVSRVDGDDVTEIFSSKADVNIVHPSRNVPGSLLIANGFDVLRLVKSADGTMTASALAHLPDFASELVEDSKGNIWVSTYSKGALVIPAKPGSGPTFHLPQSGRVLVAAVGEKSALFTDRGVILYESAGGAGSPFTEAPRTRAQAVSNRDITGAVWVAFDSPFPTDPKIPTVGRLAVSRTSEPTWSSFEVPGLSQIGQVSALYVDDRGVVWADGATGMLRLVPEELIPTAMPGAPTISSTIAPGSKLEWNHNAAEFEYSAVQFGGPESFRFQTRLSPGSGEWSPPSDNPHLSLAGLRDGNYELSVRVVSGAGLAGPPATVGFTVLPPWYRTAPAILFFALVLAAGVFGAFKWRLAFLKRQNARLEILVQKKTAQLEKANEAKSEFLANMSHEIRNPISGILGLALAFEETELDKRQRHLVDSINSCATLLAALVDDVLDFSKIEAGKIELRSAPFSVRVLVEQCVAMIAENAKAAGSTITLEVAPEIPAQVVGDSARVQQILLNYLTNALKFGAGKPIVVGATAGFHDRVRFFVRDNGVGMTESEIATLFTKFTRLESARTGNIRGTGLGLAVSRLLATKMGGRVGVESVPGKGSTFWAELPFLAVNGSSDAKMALAPGPATLRALIVEDIDYNVIAMQAVLRKLDIQSDVVNDGNQALARLQSAHYDVAFLDWNLPGMVGTEVAARYRAVEPSTRRTIIIATTAHSSEMNKEACLQAGMDAFISKPITPGKIAAALRDLGGPMRTAASIEVRSQNITFEPPVEIDLEMLTFLGTETLEGLGGQIDRFLASFDSDRVHARRIIALGAPVEIHRIAHRLMSHCSVVKYERLGRIARDIQNASATASQAELLRKFAEFEAEFETFRCKLESIRASTGSA